MLLNKLINNKTKNSLVEFSENAHQGIPLVAFGVTEPFKVLMSATLENKVLYVVKDNVTAISIQSMLAQLTNEEVVYIPPKDEILLFSKAFSKESLFARVSAINKIKSAKYIVSTIEGLLQTFPKEILSITLNKNTDYDLQKLLKTLINYGYKKTEGEIVKGTFNLRGDILDVFPINQTTPFRVDFFGDTIESIRIIDENTFRTIGNTESLQIIQCVENIFTEKDFDLIKEILQSAIKSANKNNQTRLKEISADILFAIENKDFSYLSNLSGISENSTDIFSLLPKDTFIVFDEPKRIQERANLLETEFLERVKSLTESGEVPSSSVNQLLTLDYFTLKAKEYKNVAYSTLATNLHFFNPLKIINPQVSGVTDYKLAFKEIFNDCKNWLKTGYTVIIFAGDEKKQEKLISDFSLEGIYANKEYQENTIVVSENKFDKGFIYHELKTVIIGTDNLFTKSLAERKIKPKKQTYFTAPEAGDYCVHEIHGIGRVLGNKKITTTEGTKDYVAVEYAGGDLLYIPVEQLDILTRYLGGVKPRLSKIGGKDFERIKRNAKDSIKKMSFDLKKLYEERQQPVGFKFNSDAELQKIFEDAFPFEETIDQLQASNEIALDMASDKVMDRLVCGDVGFGKTEVAFRGIFRAILNGKQTAMLAPTTILAQQHYNTAIERFKGFGIRIEVLNRFKTEKEQQQILKDLKDGKIEFIIGTHRLLSKDVEFKDLGLLVLDEEQRFGVEHKEKIKLLKKNVDTITLTATPIPRTLHMSLSGIRSISVINTPPKKRLPVQTYVTEETEMLIKDAITREINRGGQAFLLYNRVESIFTFAERIKAIIPNVKLTVVHGRMDERTMEKNVLAFYNGEYDLLVSTTIIENGIDLPRANTLIVIDADRLGLSTLYQLKGRVGRSDRLAYAYFTFKREKVLTENAYERLNAIMEFTEMGSGIKIAMRDLEIRGAGNVLGVEQHGHMDKIGYELYSKLLKEELSGKEESVVELDVRVSSFIPDEYIQSRSAKMAVYKEIAEITCLKDSVEVREWLLDAYGEIPQETENLILIAVIKRLAGELGVEKVVVRSGQVEIFFADFNVFRRQGLKSALDKYSRQTKVNMVGKPSIEFIEEEKTNEQMLSLVYSFLNDVLK
ncbi:MAG: transcription-repair coupling factor [Clostridia bacterium]|nr:transcription-repair coupling factor [Clostridia bacterium]